MNSETIGGVILVRDILLQAAMKFNRKGILKSQIDYGVRGDYAVISFGRASGLDPNTSDDIQAFVAEELGRKCYCDPQYIPAVAAVFRVNIKGL